MGKFALTAAMRGFLGSFGLPLLVAMLIGLAVVVIDQRGFERAKDQDKLRELENAELTAAMVKAIDERLDGRLADLAAKLNGKIANIDREGKTVVQPILTREIERDPRLADPDSCLSPGLLDAINTARGYSAGAELGKAGSANPATVPGSAARH